MQGGRGGAEDWVEISVDHVLSCTKGKKGTCN